MIIQYAILAFFALGGFYIVYCVSANDWATTWLEEHFDEINQRFLERGYVLYRGYTWRDMAPCQVTYGVALINPHEPHERKAICSRRMRYLINREKPGQIAWFCSQHGQYVITRRKKLELP